VGFSATAESGAYLHKFAWTRIVRHQIVKGGASPDDPALTEYWTSRRRKAPQPIDNTSLRLLKVQEGRCPICEDMLLAVDDRPQSPREWEHQPDPTPCRNLCAFEHAASPQLARRVLAVIRRYLCEDAW
jgi:hypothetical protein